MDFDLALNINEDGNYLDNTGQKKVQRSKTREMFLMKMFNAREILKWKYNYFESNPQEHRSFQQCAKDFKVYTKSFKFKKLWRLKMDKLFYEETIRINRQLLAKELQMLEQKSKPDPVISDPTRMLVNYDREVVNMIRRIKKEFDYYLMFPTQYPDFQMEKKRFLLLKLTSFGNNFTDIKMNFEKEFQFYWETRIASLCDMKITEEKQSIRNDWKSLLPVYLNSGEDTTCPEEMELLLSDSNESG